MVDLKKEIDEAGLKIPDINMGQSMAVAARMVLGLIPQFYKTYDDEDTKVAMSYACLAVFFHELCVNAKHKDKMIALLRIVTLEMLDSDAATIEGVVADRIVDQFFDRIKDVIAADEEDRRWLKGEIVVAIHNASARDAG